MTQKSIVEVNNLLKTFDEKTVIENLSLNIKEGSFVSLLGPSGCGKTVFLKTLTGLLKKNSGDINFNFAKKQKINISFAFQKSPLFPWLTILENIKICVNNEGLSNKEKTNIVLSHLKKAHLEKFKDYYPYQISGGMTQKVNILRCFCCQSELILMDEPFVFLDFIQRRELQDFTLRIWTEEKKTILFITHDIDEAIVMSDKIFLMSSNPGKVIKEFAINVARPRDVKNARNQTEYIQIFNDINQYLSFEINKINKELDS